MDYKNLQYSIRKLQCILHTHVLCNTTDATAQKYRLYYKQELIIFGAPILLTLSTNT